MHLTAQKPITWLEKHFSKGSGSGNLRKQRRFNGPFNILHQSRFYNNNHRSFPTIVNRRTTLTFIQSLVRRMLFIDCTVSSELLKSVVSITLLKRITMLKIIPLKKLSELGILALMNCLSSVPESFTFGSSNTKFLNSTKNVTRNFPALHQEFFTLLLITLHFYRNHKHHTSGVCILQQGFLSFILLKEFKLFCVKSYTASLNFLKLLCLTQTSYELLGQC